MLKVRYWIQENVDSLENLRECYTTYWSNRILKGRAALPLPGIRIPDESYKTVEKEYRIKSARNLHTGIKELPLAVIERPSDCTLVTVSQGIQTVRYKDKLERKTPVRFKVVWAENPDLIYPPFRNLLDPKWKPHFGRLKASEIENYRYLDAPVSISKFDR